LADTALLDGAAKDLVPQCKIRAPLPSGMVPSQGLGKEGDRELLERKMAVYDGVDKSYLSMTEEDLFVKLGESLNREFKYGGSVSDAQKTRAGSKLAQRTH
jgi:hypothetical protein